MYIMFNVESAALKKIKIFMFASEEKSLKSDDVKSNDENIMKSNDGISSPHGNDNEGMCFFWVTLLIKIFRV